MFVYRNETLGRVRVIFEMIYYEHLFWVLNEFVPAWLPSAQANDGLEYKL